MNECPLKRDHLKRKGKRLPTIIFHRQAVRFDGIIYPMHHSHVSLNFDHRCGPYPGNTEPVACPAGAQQMKNGGNFPR